MSESGADREAGELLALLGIEPEPLCTEHERRDLRTKARLCAAALRAAAALLILRRRG